MENEIAARYFMSKKSTVAALENFIQQFMEICDEADAAEQDILFRCIQQLFRKYLYSTLMPELTISPALMASTLIEREFSGTAVIIPTLKLEIKGKKLKRIITGAVSYDFESHPFLRDLEYYAEIAGRETLEINEFGMLPDADKASFRKDILINDRHYINILCMVALEAGLVEHTAAGNRRQAKPTGFAAEFAGLDGKKKLEHIIGAALKMCSRMISNSIPEAGELFSEENLHGILVNPGNFDNFMQSVLLKVGLRPDGIEKLAQKVLDKTDTYSLTNEEVEYADRVFLIQILMDMYFFTPFGYYLQILQPMYWEVFDIVEEADRILDNKGNYSNVRMMLFLSPEAYSLTPLGEAFVTAKTKPRRQFVLPQNVTDWEMEELVQESADYLLSLYDDEEDLDEDVDTAYEKGFQQGIDEYYEEAEATRKEAVNKKHKGQKVEKIISNPQLDGQVFVLKVKVCERKSVWREIQMYGSNTLDDLHECIRDSFELEQGHLYSFFMSNRAWDKNAEYSHPHGGGHSAKKMRISGLELRVNQKFLYLYDYGSENHFEVELTTIMEAAPGVRYPLETRRSKKN